MHLLTHANISPHFPISFITNLSVEKRKLHQLSFSIKLNSKLQHLSYRTRHKSEKWNKAIRKPEQRREQHSTRTKFLGTQWRVTDFVKRKEKRCLLFSKPHLKACIYKIYIWTYITNKFNFLSKLLFFLRLCGLAYLNLYFWCGFVDKFLRLQHYLFFAK